MTAAGTFTGLQHRRDIDGLRGFAVACGVWFHAFPNTLTGGFIGVDLFFVISGYLIATILFAALAQGNFSYRHFYSRRIRRIFPALILVLSACFALGWFRLLPSEFSELGRHMAGGAGFVANIMFWKEAGYFDTASATKLLLNLWSLGIEEQFYIAFPFLVVTAFRRRRVGLLLLSLLVLSFASNLLLSGSDESGVYYLPLTRLWGLIAGALLAWFLPQEQLLLPRYAHAGANHLLSLIGAGLVLHAAFGFESAGAYPGRRGLSPVCGAVLLIAAGPAACVNRWLLANPLLVWLGLVSYPLYLWHWPILSYAHIHYNSLPPIEVRMACLLAGTVLAWLTYCLAETPMRRPAGSRRKVIILCAAMAACGLLGAAAWQQKGFPQRFPPIMRDLATYRVEIDEPWRIHRCFLLDTEYGSQDFPPECEDTSKHPRVLIWGDSHAAVFYSGFAPFARKHAMAVSQFTLMGCPPLMGFDSPTKIHCRAANNAALARIARVRPDIVVLGGLWSKDHYDLSKLENTVRGLRKIGVARIVLIGPIPLWQMDLPRLMLLYWTGRRGEQAPPHYMSLGLAPDHAAIEEKMEALATALRIDYLSPYKVLCTKEGCLTRTGDDINDIAYYDYQHLTPAGAATLVERLGDYFTGTLKPAPTKGAVQ